MHLHFIARKKIAKLKYSNEIYDVNVIEMGFQGFSGDS